MAEGQTVTIGNKEYNLDNLSEKAKAQLANLRVADKEISRLQVQIALVKTARRAYAQSLKTELPPENE